VRQRWNGSIQSANTPTTDKEGIPRDNYALYRCMVISVTYADDPNNISKNSKNPEVFYECIIMGGVESGQILTNCRLAQYLNYSERTLTPSSKDVKKDPLDAHDGDVVWIEFVQGHDDYPTILMLDKAISDDTAAKKADGPRLIEIYNGLQRNINNRGELIMKMYGGKVTNARFVPNIETIVQEEWLSTEQVKTTFKSGLVQTIDGKNDKLDLAFKAGLSVTYDGKNDKAEIKTSGGVTATIDGKGSKISMKAGSTEVLIDGNSGKISLKGDFVDLGASVADFVTQFTQLASAFATHTHTGNLGAPTSPPMAPLLTSVGSQTVKVQS
jgi:hypothetical protein